MTTSTIDEVIILYNPNSTGDSEKNAQDLSSLLLKNAKNLKIRLKRTEYAGHAEELAQEYAASDRIILLISSSGDGGYHELINGVLSSGAKNIYTSLLPSGNANDHHRAVGTNDLLNHITSTASRSIDVIRVTSRIDGKLWVRYAHSYVGVGISSIVGKELTKENLNFFNEKWLTLKHLLRFHHVSILIKGNRVRYSSLIFSNIDQMSKVIQLSRKSTVDDGKFEISALRHRSKLYLLTQLFRAATVGLEENASVSVYEFKTIKKLLIQLDGEDFTLDANSEVKVESVHNALKVIV